MRASFVFVLESIKSIELSHIDRGNNTVIYKTIVKLLKGAILQLYSSILS